MFKVVLGYYTCKMVVFYLQSKSMFWVRYSLAAEPILLIHKYLALSYLIDFYPYNISYTGHGRILNNQLGEIETFSGKL